MTICARCDKTIEGKPVEIPIDSPTGAAPNIDVCPTPCRPTVPRQTVPLPDSPRQA